MTDPQSLDQIRSLLLTFPGITSAAVFLLHDTNEVRIRFRCTDVNSLRDIAVASVWSNNPIQLGDPDHPLCCEPDDSRDLPCDVVIPDNEYHVPTRPERFGVFLSVQLAQAGLMTNKELNALHVRWNTRLANIKYE
jgi:hypothetical protein